MAKVMKKEELTYPEYLSLAKDRISTIPLMEVDALIENENEFSKPGLVNFARSFSLPGGFFGQATISLRRKMLSEAIATDDEKHREGIRVLRDDEGLIINVMPANLAPMFAEDLPGLEQAWFSRDLSRVSMNKTLKMTEIDGDSCGVGYIFNYSPFLARKPAIQSHLIRQICTNGATWKGHMSSFSFGPDPTHWGSIFKAATESSATWTQVLYDEATRAAQTKLPSVPLEVFYKSGAERFVSKSLVMRTLKNLADPKDLPAFQQIPSDTVWRLIQHMSFAAQAFQPVTRMNMEAQLPGYMRQLNNFYLN